jgi:hypothetical protein
MAERENLLVESVESVADRKIREAQREGAFDALPGAGKPLPDRGYHPDWWIVDKLRREQVSFLPPALELRRDVERTLESLPRLRDEAAVRAALEALNTRIRTAAASTTKGPPLDVAPLDVEQRLAAWRSA